MDKLYPRGSQWRKWDLHIHTPDSLVQYYSGTKDEAWKQFIKELEALPPEFKVIGINDYWFLDGYRKVCEEKSKGRLANIDLILPIIELRINKFGGSESKLSQVNFHVIFSNNLGADVIQQQFLNALPTKYKLNDKYAKLQINWGGVITPESLADLGKSIIASVPPKKRTREPNEPLIEGFNNLSVSVETVLEILSGPYFKGECLTAVGKTEWWDIKWNDQSIAEKKTIINNADWVFIASANIDDWWKAKNHLSENQVNNRLLDCSDAHHFSTSTQKDRIGNCFTWVKADPTFAGLQMALFEPDERVFIGEKPEKTKHIENNPTKYIRKLSVNKKQDSPLTEDWFDQTSIEFNSDLVAIIGNKGSGKSALTDILGLIGNTPNGSNFSFLNQRRFGKPPEGKSQHFEAELAWESNTVHRVDNLSRLVDETAAETIKYIPQGLFEEICSEVPGGKKGKFDDEIERVIFSRLPSAERLSMPNLSDLIEFKTQETYGAIALLKTDIQDINRTIVELENESSIDYQKRITGQYELKKRELEAHDDKKPKPVSPPTQKGQNLKLVKQILNAETKQTSLGERIKKAQIEKNKVTLQLTLINKLGQRIENLTQMIKRFYDESKEDGEALGLALSDLVSFNISLEQLDSKRQQLQNQETSINKDLDIANPSSLVTSLQEIEDKLVNLRSKLDEPSRIFQQYQQALQEWAATREKIIGTDDQPDSLAYFEAKLNAIKTVVPRLKENREKRLEITKRIYEQIKSLASENRKLYQPVQEFIDANPIAKGKLSLNFDVSIVDVELSNRFFEWVSRSSAGSFHGTVEGAKVLQDIIARHSFETDTDVELFLSELMSHLVSDKRGSNQSPDMQSLMKDRKSVESFYDYLFALDYLRPRYVLKMVDKELSQLSPGEKGALLLIFYLLVDKSDVPMVIDQPEENLDNQTVYELLVDAIKDAKKRRQIILVTHNPNLAVVCDAEQVICSTIDKANNNKVTYTTGSIENPVINTSIVNILEGTKPAFDNRKLKYHA